MFHRSKSEEDKAFIHANCVFDDASQVNESGFTLECYMYLVLFDTSLEIESECSVFLFEKRCAEKLHKPKRKETVTEILRSSVRQLERFRHPKILHVLHPIEECADTLAFASEPVFASLANILAHQEGSGNHGGITATGASQQPTVRPAHAREYNFLDIEYKYGILQVVGTATP
ncbi:hypothetical protein GEV33_010104 [Tenebrio molitor]|uniref:Protein kinase domain-containing protein n=1 Tax=Tenebrio molitor TaxID=7067 RepID=A0A8J6HEK4_TENMO|nr:hypothetical protein GEV33_010104 [Tenebrio molitor]